MERRRGENGDCDKERKEGKRSDDCALKREKNDCLKKKRKKKNSTPKNNNNPIFITLNEAPREIYKTKPKQTNKQK